MKQNKILQSGRSMVEILGVLAVAGVLSIGAVSGYKYGMDKYRAIQTINEVQVRALGLMQQVDRGEIIELNMEKGKKTDLGYIVEANIDEMDTTYFYIHVKKIPTGVCTQILKERWTIPSAIYVKNSLYNGKNEKMCGNGEYAPTMTFEFANNFIKSSEYYDAIIDKNIPSVSLVQHSCSDSEDPLGDKEGNCYPCDTSYNINVGENGQCSEICPNRTKTGYGYCVLSCSSEKPLVDANGDCYSCDVSSSVYVGENGQCTEICPNRTKTEGGACQLPCSKEAPLQLAHGGCASCNSQYAYVGENGQCNEVCPNNQLVNGYCTPVCPNDKPLAANGSNCYACDYTAKTAAGMLNVGETGLCSEICPDRIKDQDNHCIMNCGHGIYADKPLTDYYGNCYSCDTQDAVQIRSGGKCTEVCSNREYSSGSSSTTCVLSSSCSKDNPLQGVNGKCYACNTSESVQVGVRGKCEATCPNRVHTKRGYCALPCSASAPLMLWDGRCYSCDYSGSVSTATGECSEVCPNRMINGSGYCVLSCPADNPLYDVSNNVCKPCSSDVFVGENGKCGEVCPGKIKNGILCYSSCPSDAPLTRSNYLPVKCYSCDTPESIYVSSSGVCTEVCPNRQLNDRGYCALPCYETNKPLMDYYGSCHSCDEIGTIETMDYPCSDVCSNRSETISGKCVLKCGVGIYEKRPLMHQEGVCYACDTKNEVYVGEGECEEVCANRRKYNGYCYLNEE